MGNFAEDTEVRGANGHYEAELSPLWSAWGPVGGYVVAIGLRAMAAETSLRRPASMSCQFLAPVRPGSIAIEVKTLKRGKRSHALQFAIHQEDQLKLLGFGWFIDQGMSGNEHERATMPAVPAPTKLASFSELAPDFKHWFAMWHGGVDGRPTQWSAAPINSEPIWRTWMRLQHGLGAAASDPVIDAARSVFWMDMMPWNAAIQPHLSPEPGGARKNLAAVSLDLNMMFHSAAVHEEWLLCDAEAPVVREGMIGSVGRLWTPDGRLIASGTSSMLWRGPIAGASSPGA